LHEAKQWVPVNPLNVLTMYASASELPAALLDDRFEHHVQVVTTLKGD
jgi:hypothetical protein